MTTRRPTPSRPTRPGGNRIAVILAGVAVVALAVTIAVLTVEGTGSGPTVEEIAGSPRIDGTPLPPATADPAEDTAVGTNAPMVTGAGFDGSQTVIAAPGQPQLITFMAAWCPHCQEELPEVAQWLSDGRAPEGLAVVAVPTGLDATRPNWPPDAWFDRVGYPGPVLVDDAHGSVAEAYGLTGTPYWVGLDAEGRVVVRVAGRVGLDALDRIASMVMDAG